MTPTDSSHVAEIVTFKLNKGVTDAQFLELNAESQDFVNTHPGFVSRHLSKGDDGAWTDYVVWDSADNALRAQSSFMEQDFAAGLVGAIDADTISMRHQKILWHPKW